MSKLIPVALFYSLILFFASSCNSNRKIIEYFATQHEENYKICINSEQLFDLKNKSELCLEYNEKFLNFSSNAVKSSDSLKKLNIDEYLIFYSVSNINNKTCSFVYVPNKNGSLGTASSIQCNKFSKDYLAEIIKHWNDWINKKEDSRFSSEKGCCGHMVYYIISKNRGQTKIYELY